MTATHGVEYIGTSHVRKLSAEDVANLTGTDVQEDGAIVADKRVDNGFVKTTKALAEKLAEALPKEFKVAERSKEAVAEESSETTDAAEDTETKDEAPAEKPASTRRR